MKSKKVIIITVVILLLVLGAGMTALRSTNLNDASVGVSKRATSLSMQSSAPMSGMSGGFQADSMESGMAYSAEDSVGVSSTAIADENITDDKKVIKNGNMNLKVDNADDAASQISSITKGNGGEVFSSNFHQTSKDIKSGTIVVKVPVDNFEKTFEELKEVASLVVNESTSGKDVTEQYTDLQSRLRNKQAEEQSIAKILEQSGKITDVLAVTKELSRVRGEIEILQGRIRLIDSQTDMATISISLSEDPKITVVDSWRPLQVAKDSVNDLIRNIQQFIDFIIVLAIRAIPILLIYLIVFGILYAIGKKIYHKLTKKGE